jgi:hypothetical protein
MHGNICTFIGVLPLTTSREVPWCESPAQVQAQNSQDQTLKCEPSIPPPPFPPANDRDSGDHEESALLQRHPTSGVSCRLHHCERWTLLSQQRERVDRFNRCRRVLHGSVDDRIRCAPFAIRSCSSGFGTRGAKEGASSCRPRHRVHASRDRGRAGGQ